jgi:hypothetical protein
MARITATEMVGVPLTTGEVRRLLDALAEGRLGPPADPENVVLGRKLDVLLQVARATESRRAARARAEPDQGPHGRPRRR